MPNRITRPTCAAISTVTSTNRAAKTCRLLGSCSRISASNPTQYRPRQTVEGLATTLNLPTNTLSFHESLYLALPQTLAQAAATFPDSVQTGLLFAHNPGLEEWVAQLTGARVELPTAGLVAIQLGCFSWTDIEQKYGQLLYFIIPLLIRAITQ